MIEPLSSQPALIDQVHDRLVAAIADGTLDPGEKLTQETVAEMLGVSRQPVSHALQLLRRRGLAVESGKRGLVVAPMDPDRLRGLYQVRAALDGLAASLAAARAKAGTISQAALDDIIVLVRQGTAMANGRAEISSLINADMTFHSAVYALSENQAIVDTAAEQWPHFLRTMGAVLSEMIDPDRIWREHQEILDLILAGEAPDAEAAARSHAERAGEATAQKLESMATVA
jgi:DNA-binding GntR family transcriptional regulator